MTKPNFDDNELEINITPIVDVFLVLLLMFILAFFVKTPGASNVQQKISEPESHLTSDDITESKKNEQHLFLSTNGKYSFIKHNGTSSTFFTTLEELKLNKNTYVIIHADENVPYKHVIQITSSFKKQGFVNVYLELKKIKGG